MDKKETKAVKDRRALLTSLVAGSAVVTGSKALPKSWSRPLTNAVLLPSHAATTGDWAYGDKGQGPINDGKGGSADYQYGDGYCSYTDDTDSSQYFDYSDSGLDGTGYDPGGNTSDRPVNCPT